MQQQKKQLILIGGPTASGKTKLAIELAQHLNTVILNADSRQFYKEMTIGTAVPTPEERALVPHYFVQSHDAAEPLTAADYENEALLKLEELFQVHDQIIVCGGSGLYMQALAMGLDPLPPANPEYRAELEALFLKDGINAISAILKEKDTEKARLMDLKNPRRIIRALEIIEAGPVEIPVEDKKPRPFEVLSFFLNLDRENLYQRIDERVESIMLAGLLDEVKNLMPLRESAALQTVGYRELFDHLDGLYTLEEAVNKIKQHTRNYAKRQLTWFRNKGNYQEIHQLSEAIAAIDLAAVSEA